MWILEFYKIYSILRPENRNRENTGPCIIAAADTVQSKALVGRLKIDQQKKINISENTAWIPL